MRDVVKVCEVKQSKEIVKPVAKVEPSIRNEYLRTSSKKQVRILKSGLTGRSLALVSKPV